MITTLWKHLPGFLYHKISLNVRNVLGTMDGAVIREDAQMWIKKNKIQLLLMLVDH